jgi:hypothetical protein
VCHCSVSSGLSPRAPGDSGRAISTATEMERSIPAHRDDVEAILGFLPSSGS